MSKFEKVGKRVFENVNSVNMLSSDSCDSGGYIFWEVDRALSLTLWLRVSIIYVLI